MKTAVELDAATQKESESAANAQQSIVPEQTSSGVQSAQAELMARRKS